MARTFRLKDFDGPLDLLLHLIGKAKINIRDIFISEITDQYIESVAGAEDLDMEDATEFLVMASTLLEIKSRAMLPKVPDPVDGEEDPEQELIRRLEEYKRLKDGAASMRSFEDAAKAIFAKLPDEFPLPPQEYELTGLTLDGLVAALNRVLTRKPPEVVENNHYAPRDIRRDEHTVQECMLTLLQAVKKEGSVRFEEAFSAAPTKEEVVTLFLALLELLRLGEMHAEQGSVYDDIILVKGPLPSTDEEEENGK